MNFTFSAFSRNLYVSNKIFYWQIMFQCPVVFIRQEAFTSDNNLLYHLLASEDLRNFIP